MEEPAAGLMPWRDATPVVGTWPSSRPGHRLLAAHWHLWSHLYRNQARIGTRVHKTRRNRQDHHLRKTIMEVPWLEKPGVGVAQDPSLEVLPRILHAWQHYIIDFLTMICVLATFIFETSCWRGSFVQKPGSISLHLVQSFLSRPSQTIHLSNHGR